MITRRGLLAGILAAGVAPAIVRHPMRIAVPKPLRLHNTVDYGQGDYSVLTGVWNDGALLNKFGDPWLIVPPSMAAVLARAAPQEPAGAGVTPYRIEALRIR